jgi:hypothetical protein
MIRRRLLVGLAVPVLGVSVSTQGARAEWAASLYFGKATTAETERVGLSCSIWR